MPEIGVRDTGGGGDGDRLGELRGEGNGMG